MRAIVTPISPADNGKARSLPQEFSKTENALVVFFVLNLCRHKVEWYGIGPRWGLPSNCHSFRAICWECWHFSE